jgi:hypothetical protein
MKTIIYGITLAHCLCVTAFADIPTQVRSQLRSDAQAASRTYKGAQGFEVFAKQVEGLGSDFVSAFDFNPEQLSMFESGNGAPTDDAMQKAAAEVIAAVGSAPLPPLLKHYEALRATGSLSAKQKVLHIRYCRLVMTRINRNAKSK